jgi:hypothetical protein|tara:strand:+ start:347 stop:682 length:336 start_codon:yes stop_codon:yes gene_type:complete
MYLTTPASLVLRGVKTKPETMRVVSTQCAMLFFVARMSMLLRTSAWLVRLGIRIALAMTHQAVIHRVIKFFAVLGNLSKTTHASHASQDLLTLLATALLATIQIAISHFVK